VNLPTLRRGKPKPVLHFAGAAPRGLHKESQTSYGQPVHVQVFHNAPRRRQEYYNHNGRREVLPLRGVPPEQQKCANRRWMSDIQPSLRKYSWMETSQLIARVADPGTLRTAWLRMLERRSGSGDYAKAVAAFAAKAESNLAALRRELLEGTYVPEPSREVAIPKGPGKQGRRTLRIPALPDKIVQEAVRSVIEPRLDRLFLDCSYGYRPGKAPVRAIRRVAHYICAMRKQWVATADIDDFFGSLDHQRLLRQLAAVVRDEGILRLIQLWLRMGAVDRSGRWRDVRSGVSQGAVISPLLANLYLHPFDQALTSRGLGLVRYADDFVILCADAPEAEQALAMAREFLEHRLGLRLNANPRPIGSVSEGFTFLGVCFRGQERMLDPAKEKRIAATLDNLSRSAGTVGWSRTLELLNRAVEGWRRYYGAILPEAELAKIERPHRDALIRILAEEFRRKTLRTVSQAETALGEVDLLNHASPIQRRRFLRAIVREARVLAAGQRGGSALAQTGTPTTGAGDQLVDSLPPSGQATSIGTVRTAEDPVVRASPATAMPNVSPRAVEAAVRARKRKYLVRAVQTSELVLDTPGHAVGKRGELVAVRYQRKVAVQVPLQRLSAITVATHGISLSSDIIAACARRDVPVLLVNPVGRVEAVVSKPSPQSARLQLLQLQAVARAEPALELAKRFAKGKMKNQLALMKYASKYRRRRGGPLLDQLSAYRREVRELVAQLEEVRLDAGGLPAARNRVLSLEARAAARYWDLVSMLLPASLSFPGRRRRGARDPVNMLLNYGYAILASRVQVALAKSGLCLQISFLHAPRKNEPTLVYDLMEEFRSPVVERAVLAMIGRRQAVRVEQDGLLSLVTRRLIIAAVCRRLATPVVFRRQEVQLQDVLRIQASALARHLEGRTRYRPFLARW